MNPGSTDEDTKIVKNTKYEILIEHPDSKAKSAWGKKQVELETSICFLVECIKKTKKIKIEVEFNQLKYDRAYTITHDTIDDINI